jgi:DNA-binding transcriptional LysR family regulator
MDFAQLTTFLEVAKSANFSRAGKKLFLSQPAVSAQIRQLEMEYGAKLLDRFGKKVRLTSAGDALLEYAEKLLALRNESLRAVADQANTPRGTLLIGANEATCLYVLPEVFAEYHRLYSDVQINIYRNFSNKVLETVLGRRGNCHAPDKIAEPENSLDFPGSLAADGEPVEPPGEEESS